MDDVEAVIIAGGNAQDIEAAILINILRNEAGGNAPQQFNLDEIPNEDCAFLFRFEKEDIYRLYRALQLPQFVQTYNQNRVAGLTGLCLLLRRLAYPNRLRDSQALFGYSPQAMSLIINKVMNIILEYHGHLLSNLQQVQWLTEQRLAQYGQAIQNKGAPILTCCGFIDGTARAICKPSVDQENYYSGHKRFGFTSEFAPRYIIRSEIRCKKTNCVRRICDYESPQDLHDLLVDFIHMIYFKYALISPKDRPIVIVESLLCPTLFRETLAKVLFLQYEVSSVLVLPSHLVALASLAVDTALVVDLGYKEAVVIPVCYGLPIVQAWQALPLGGEAIHSNLKYLLSSSNTGVQNLPEKVFEDIKIRCCFVTKKSRAEQLNLARPEITPPPEVKYPYGGTETLTVTGKVREKAFEVLYEEDNDHLCLSTMILDAILKVDIDLRQKLAENLILIGGTVMTLGFKARLKEELERQLQNERYKVLNLKIFKFHSPPCKENYAAWLGGAIYGATEFLAMKAVSKDFYLREKHLPDWINLKDTTTAKSPETTSVRAL